MGNSLRPLMGFIFYLGKSLFDHMLQLSNQLKLVPSRCSREIVFVIEGGAEGLCLLPKLGVSLKFA